MNVLPIAKTLAFLMLIVSGSMLVPAGIALYNSDITSFFSFSGVILPIAGICGSFLYSLRKKKDVALSTRDGFLLVATSWIFVSLVGALPFYVSGSISSYTDAFFETISGFTTTGASILVNVEAMPSAMLFWRSLTHWLGGMGIVVLAVAVLPMMGIGGLQLINAEAPGPVVERITPRITDTAKILWLIYIGFTVALTLLLLMTGMDIYDATTHAFGTVSTGGFSTMSASVGHYNSSAVYIIITIFMLLGGISFSLHFRFLTGRFDSLRKLTELKAYLIIFLVATLAITFSVHGVTYNSFFDSAVHASFQTASFLTTTGYSTANFEKWPLFSQGVLFLLMFVGGCSGSTAGGIKVFRLVILLKQAFIEMRYLIHPRGIFTLKINGQAVRKNLVYAVASFFFLYIFILLCTFLVVASSGQDLTTSFTAALTTLGNIGPDFGDLEASRRFAILPDYVKWFLSFAMLVGRLELYTILVIFTPEFWKRR